MGRDYDAPAPDGKRTLSELMQKGVFPFFQGAPNLNSISAKARALERVVQPEFKELAQRIVDNARVLAKCFVDKGYKVITGGTDNHLVVMDVLSKGITGIIAEKALEDCNIIVNKNRIPGDQKSAFVTSGIPIGSNSLALKKMGVQEMSECADMVEQVLSNISAIDDRAYKLDPAAKESVLADVHKMCRRFPIPCYPKGSADNGVWSYEKEDQAAVTV